MSLYRIHDLHIPEQSNYQSTLAFLNGFLYSNNKHHVEYYINNLTYDSVKTPSSVSFDVELLGDDYVNTQFLIDHDLVGNLQ